MKYLYPYECEKRNLSHPSELQTAIEGNRREGRRSAYNQYDVIARNQNGMNPMAQSIQMQQMQQMQQRLINATSQGKYYNYFNSI